MSTNKTQNFGLHVWEGGDPFLRSEFNENFALLDESVRVVIGAYTGKAEYNDVTPQRIELGMKPRVVLVMGVDVASQNSAFSALGGPDGSLSVSLALDDTGFSALNGNTGIGLNRKNKPYYYMALV